MARLDDPTSMQPYQGDAGDEQPEEQPGQFFSPQVRYAGQNVTCANCEYFDGTSQCSNQEKIADGGPDVEAGGRCEQFDPAQDNDADDQQDSLKQALAATKPFGAGAGMSNS